MFAGEIDMQVYRLFCGGHIHQTLSIDSQRNLPFGPLPQNQLPSISPLAIDTLKFILCNLESPSLLFN